MEKTKSTCTLTIVLYNVLSLSLVPLGSTPQYLAQGVYGLLHSRQGGTRS